MTSSNGNIFRVTGHLCPHKGQWRGSLVFSLIYLWINGWVNNREAGDLRRCRTHYDVSAIWVSIDKAIRRLFLRSCEVSRFRLRFERLLWYLIGYSTAVLLSCMSNCKAIWWFQYSITKIRDFQKSYDNVSYRLAKKALVAIHYYN